MLNPLDDNAKVDNDFVKTMMYYNNQKFSDGDYVLYHRSMPMLKLYKTVQLLISFLLNFRQVFLCLVQGSSPCMHEGQW